MQGETYKKARELRERIAAINEKIAAYRQPFADVLFMFWHDRGFKISEKNEERDRLREKVITHYEAERDRLEAEFSSL